MNIIGGKISVDKINAPKNVCSIGDKICSQSEELELIKKYLRINNISFPENAEPGEILNIILKTLNVPDELTLWTDSDFSRTLGMLKSKKILGKIFKPIGPCNSTKLLNNFNIDNTLHQWEINSLILFKKKFKHIPFQMIDFLEDHNSELANLDIVKDIIKQGYNCFGVVLNTDISSGPGKHWFCIFGDFGHKGTETDPFILEYFNSSGNPPMDSVRTWLSQAEYELAKQGYHCKIIKSIKSRVQNSDTECGVFCLIYILSRLENKPHNWFEETGTSDNEMIKFRAQLFRCD